jgi:hypothetical protein
MDAAPSHRPRLVLTELQARQIFQLKYSHGFPSSHSASSFFATQFKISSKAIRDIWKGRSWLKVTFDLWNTADRPIQKALGRPKGKKDSKPRKISDQRKATSVGATPAVVQIELNDEAVPCPFAELKIIFDREELILKKSIHALQQENMAHHHNLDPSIWSLQIQPHRDPAHSHETGNDGFKHHTPHPDSHQDSLAYISALALIAQGPPPSPSAWPQRPLALFPNSSSTSLQWAVNSLAGSSGESRLADPCFPHAVFPDAREPPPALSPIPPPAHLGGLLAAAALLALLATPA